MKLLSALLLLAVPLLDDKLLISHPLSEAEIDEALSIGKDPDMDAPGLSLGAAGFDFAPMRDDSNRSGIFMQQRRSRGTTGFGVEVHTPWTWIARKAREAAGKGREMLPIHVNDMLLEPTVRVVCYSDRPSLDHEGVLGTRVERVTLRSTAKRGFEEVEPSSSRRIADRVRAPSGEIVDMGPLLGEFALDSVSSLSGLDKKGELYVVIHSEDGKEKKFKVKSKHFEKLR